MVRIALLLGGPSEERGISLNSARSVADHLVDDGIQLEEIIYFDRRLQPHSISRGLLYCNTPSDFDFKLAHYQSRLSDDDLVHRLRNVDIAFPAIHGAFGEDGQVQALLERAEVPYVGSSSAACAVAFDKFRAGEALRTAGISTVPSVLVTAGTAIEETNQLWDAVFPEADKLVLKPAQAGSSIDVHIAPDRAAAAEILSRLLNKYDRVVIQPRMTGVEITTTVLEGPAGPVALIPIQVELNNRVDEDEIFDYRRKYLASNDSHYYCPPPQDLSVIADIQFTSERVFSALGLRDFARIDGWLQPDGQILVSDVNPISGMEQNSFLFIQAAQLGMNHRDVLRFVVRAAARRTAVNWVDDSPASPVEPGPRKRLAVLFGGNTAERQVSVLSGTNVWLKLLGSQRYEPVPHLLDPEGTVWQLPYSTALRHSVEEVVEACRDAQRLDDRRRKLAESSSHRLQLSSVDLHTPVEPPEKMTMDQFLNRYDLVFLALHGGSGENGTFQDILDQRGIRYNGSDATASRLCMDKYETGLIIGDLAEEGIYTARRIRVAVPAALNHAERDELWHEIVATCGSHRVVVKPLDDGCSAGVLPLGGAEDLTSYITFVNAGVTRVSGEAFSLLAGKQIIEMPTHRPDYLLFEEFIETDDIQVDDRDQILAGATQLTWGQERDTGWVEVTAGVIGLKGHMVAMHPSMTIASRGILSLEEKFMGGTGINITPPPGPPLGRVEPEAVQLAKTRIARVANALGMGGYGRIDAFMHCKTGEIIVIEANTLPGLTPATVFYHQGLAEQPPVPPREILEKIVDLALARP